ncbi:hypothetical protein AN639_03750 [Candidatus Epulonipiscium fishelsonii]|uniref:Uncharacterized protein n=1 Tax=Candidatus Epulonipiscium fishelsonii TaxID=77094 RepID=A0ACC8X6Q3_9FIRM|nr:hypothetical protein AN396_12775 [Epulopiscium sp. SCG-B11WGA-EpuloA1]ONI41476.1 hypothetical protein AN639_03750 [Epulopiscium sp. SCG-B05WGA-EpuloA1]
MYHLKTYIEDQQAFDLEQLELLTQDGILLEDILVEQDWLKEENILFFKSIIYNTRSCDLRDIVLDFNLANIVPEKIAIKHNIVPIELVDDSLYIVMNNPLFLPAIEDVTLITGYKVIPLVGRNKMITNCISQLYLNVQEAEDLFEQESFNENKYEIYDTNQGVINQFISAIINQAIKLKSSDIHIEPFKSFVQIRYRVDGKLRKIKQINRDNLNSIIICIKVIGKMDITENKLPQDGHLDYKFNNEIWDLRLSTIPTTYGEKVVMRLRQQNAKPYSFEQLGFLPIQMNLLKSLVIQKSGLVLVTGPTGSGKSTTLMSIMNILNTPSVNIVTVEDPIETTLEGINQIEVNEKKGLTFEKVLRATLRQDFNILMIGEIRDKITAEIASTAALTGHSIWSTLHTDNSIGAFLRIIDMGIDKFLANQIIKGVIAQKLVRRLCSICKQKIIIKQSILDLNIGDEVYTHKGCSSCNNEGYTDRIGVYEILIPKLHLKNIEYNQVGLEIIAQNNGLKTLLQNAIELVKLGITSTEEIVEVFGLDGELN